MNKDELVKIININELNPKDTTEKLFCVAIIKNCSSYVQESILEDYNKLRNCVEGRTDYWKNPWLHRILDRLWNESDLYTYINGHELLDNENYKKLHHIEINENNLILIYDMIKKIMSEISELLSKNISLHNKLDKSLNDYIEFWTKKY
mgnify:FL=1